MPEPTETRPLFWRAGAAALALPVFLLPLRNPDIFWHLSAGRWVLEHRGVPRVDFLSFTRAGTPWSDFEWLAQTCFAVLHAGGGMAALWLLKALLLSAAWTALLPALRRQGVPPFLRAAGLVLWAGIVLPHSDARPELFSLLLTGLTAAWLERRRLSGGRPSARETAGVFAVFALWSNLHAGFPVGLGLILLYAGIAAIQRRRVEAAGLLSAAAAGAAGGLCNPYGAEPYRIAWSHWREGSVLARFIAEWRPMTAENPLHWPFWAALALTAASAAWAMTRPAAARRLPWAPVLAAVIAGAGALGHSRLSVYFAPLSVLALGALFGAGLAPAARSLRGPARAAFIAAALYLAWAMPHLRWNSFFDDRFVPTQAAEFLAEERTVFEPLRVYNQWQWGGYLGWRLRPWYHVFEDGRYIFHPQLEETGRAMSSATAWADFMAKRRLDAALLPNLGAGFFDSYMPPARWALVHRDAKALVFVSRAAAPAEWISRRERRYLTPDQ